MFDKIKNFINKLNSGYFYNLDKNTLIKYLEEQVEFANQNDLEAVENLNIYYNNKKYELSIWNFTKSKLKQEQEQGFSVLFDNKEYRSISNLFRTATVENKLLDEIKYFKIELINGDSTVLNDYKKNHPELTDEFIKNNQ